MSVYIEHTNPFSPPSIRRYAGLVIAASVIAKSGTHESDAAVLSGLMRDGGHWLGHDNWRVVTVEQYRARVLRAQAVLRRMEDDADVEDLNG